MWHGRITPIVAFAKYLILVQRMRRRVSLHAAAHHSKHFEESQPIQAIRVYALIRDSSKHSASSLKGEKRKKTVALAGFDTGLIVFSGLRGLQSTDPQVRLRRSTTVFSLLLSAGQKNAPKHLAGEALTRTAINRTMERSFATLAC